MTPTARRLLLAALLAGCTPAELTPAIDARVGEGDAASADLGAATPDVPAPPDVTATPSDAPVVGDASPLRDAPATLDAATPQDAPAPLDAGTATDAPSRPDGGVSTDAPPARDAGVATDAPTARDGGVSTDVPPPRDVPAPQDVGCAVAARVLSPAPGEVIETCSESGAAVFYDFRIEAGPIALAQPRWRTPDGDLAPSPDLARTSPPWVFRRQVGGPTAAAPALGVFPNALRGTWRFEVLVTDGCGRETLVSQTFQLTFTNRRCPNP